MAARVLRLATRPSPLARWQADEVAHRLAQAFPGLEVEQVLVTTTGDQRTDVPLHAIGGQGVFAKEVQQAVLDGRADVAVHSAKDLPAAAPTEGLVLAALVERGDPRDALVGARLDDLAPGATVATGAVRRQAQLAALRPDLHFVDLRGNIHTRLGKVPEGGAVVMAVAALQRLGLDDRIDHVLPTRVMVPQAGQGAIAIECRARDDVVRRFVEVVDHGPTRCCVEAERSFLAALGGGCDLPVGAHAVRDGPDEVVLEVFLGDADRVFRAERRGAVVDSHRWAADLAREARASVAARPPVEP